MRPEGYLALSASPEYHLWARVRRLRIGIVYLLRVRLRWRLSERCREEKDGPRALGLPCFESGSSALFTGGKH